MASTGKWQVAFYCECWRLCTLCTRHYAWQFWVQVHNWCVSSSGFRFCCRESRGRNSACLAFAWGLSSTSRHHQPSSELYRPRPQACIAPPQPLRNYPI